VNPAAVQAAKRSVSLGADLDASDATGSKGARMG
jgi:hypothetical protein